MVKNKHLRIIIFWFDIDRSLFSFQMFDKTNLQKPSAKELMKLTPGVNLIKLLGAYLGS
jgi:hypothetical protein